MDLTDLSVHINIYRRLGWPHNYRSNYTKSGQLSHPAHALQGTFKELL